MKVVVGEDKLNLPLLKELIAERNGISDGNRCEYTFKLMQCGDKAAKARGMNISDLFN